MKSTWVFCCRQKPQKINSRGQLSWWRNPRNLANTSSSEVASTTLEEKVSTDTKLTQRVWASYREIGNTTSGNKAKDITPSIAWKREASKEEALGDLLWKDERGSSSVRWTFKGNVGKISKRQGGAHMGFSECIDTILNWTKRGKTRVVEVLS